MTLVDATLARWIAKQQVITEIKRRGEKVREYSAKDLIEAADEYVRTHRAEIMREVVMRRWERRFRRADIATSAQIEKP